MPFCYCLFVVVVVINGKLSRFALSFLFISSFSLSFVLFFVLSLYQASELECVANVIAVVVVFELIVVAVAARI